MFYEHDDEYIPLKIILKEAVGYYNDYKDTSKYDAKYSSSKRMNFKLDDDSFDKMYDIFEHIEEKLGIDLNNFTYESKGENILKQLCLMKHALEKIVKLIQFQMKILNINVEYYYKCNLFIIIWKIKIYLVMIMMM